MTSTSDAVAREASWLTTYGDSLPTLIASQGGPWQVVQGYMARTPPMKQSSIYVLRHSVKIERVGGQRSMATYGFRLKLWWPLTSSTGSEESDQVAFDAALDLLIQRVQGLPLDHTHGQRFLSVAENPAYIMVDIDDPATTIPTTGNFSATMSYFADDFQFAN